MTVRIDVSRLDDEVRESLERGEAVEIERDGEIVGRLEACGPPRLVDWRAYFEARKKDPPLDDKFEEDMAAIHREMNRPVAPTPWE